VCVEVGVEVGKGLKGVHVPCACACACDFICHDYLSFLQVRSVCVGVGNTSEHFQCVLEWHI